jgi:hypothetical protein
MAWMIERLLVALAGRKPAKARRPGRTDEGKPLPAKRTTGARRARAGAEGRACAVRPEGRADRLRPAAGKGRQSATGRETKAGAGVALAGLERAVLDRLEALEASLSVKLQAHLISVVQALSEVVVAEQRKAAAGQACLLRGREGRSPHPDPLPPRAGEGEMQPAPLVGRGPVGVRAIW